MIPILLLVPATASTNECVTPLTQRGHVPSMDDTDVPLDARPLLALKGWALFATRV